jgi:hypothetical protein
VNHRSVTIVLLAATFALASGCHYAGDPNSLWPLLGNPAPPAGPLPGPPHPEGTPTANPLRVTGVDREFLWNQLVDTVDDYFQIDYERRVQTIGGVVTEGQIETHYLPGATAMEPWRWDSASDFELAHATLQSIRRRASIRAVPVGGGLDVYVAVFKEQEDVDYPAQVTPGSSTPRHDVSLGRTVRTTLPAQRTLGWMPQGRDAALEQEILHELYGRLYESPAAGPGYFP